MRGREIERVSRRKKEDRVCLSADTRPAILDPGYRWKIAILFGGWQNATRAERNDWTCATPRCSETVREVTDRVNRDPEVVAFAHGKRDGPGNRRRSTRCYRRKDVDGRAHLQHVIRNRDQYGTWVKHPYTEDRTILHHPYFAVDRPDFPGQTLLFNAVSLSSVPRVVPRRLGNRPQDDQKSPALSVARPRYITTNQPAHHNPAHHLRIFHFFTHHGPTADRPSVHGTSRHHHHHTLVRSLYTVPRSLARLALALTRSFLRLSLSLHLRTPSRCERVRYRYT